ncbi:MAG: ligase-associated DNA damage response endonuclease PdeM [Ferruginibacter sp.]
MNVSIPHQIFGNTFFLNTDRTIFWQEEKALILSDLHLGKSGHFRKSGIGIPQNIFKEDMQRLFAAVQFHKPSQLIIVGDFFHSDLNKEGDLFLKWRNDIGNLPIHLVKGNHDILKRQWYEEAAIILHEKSFSLQNFSFMHDINDCSDEDEKFCFSGHIHPGIRIRGMGKQSLQLPCFYFTKKYAVLPAFGKFTGTFRIHPAEGDNVFALVENSILKIQ